MEGVLRAGLVVLPREGAQGVDFRTDFYGRGHVAGEQGDVFLLVDEAPLGGC